MDTNEDDCCSKFLLSSENSPQTFYRLTLQRREIPDNHKENLETQVLLIRMCLLVVLLDETSDELCRPQTSRLQRLCSLAGAS